MDTNSAPAPAKETLRQRRMIPPTPPWSKNGGGACAAAEGGSAGEREVGGAPHTVFHWEDGGGACRPFATAVFPSPAKHGPRSTQALFWSHRPSDQHPGSHLFAQSSRREQETQRDRANVLWRPPFSLRSAMRGERAGNGRGNGQSACVATSPGSAFRRIFNPSGYSKRTHFRDVSSLHGL